MPSSFVAYIDESGDEGFDFGCGCSDWFVLSAAITTRKQDLEIVKLVDEVKKAAGKHPKHVLHFRKLKHKGKTDYIARISKSPLRVATVLVDKRLLSDPEKFQKPNLLYFYTARFLLERISWYCRDFKPKLLSGDGTVDVIFSNRSGLPYDGLRGYMTHLKTITSDIEWDIVRPEQMYTYSGGKRMGLQVADAAAASFFCAVDKSKKGCQDHCYALGLKPVTYTRYGKTLGYGVKFFPRECVAADQPFWQEWYETPYKKI